MKKKSCPRCGTAMHEATFRILVEAVPRRHYNLGALHGYKCDDCGVVDVPTRKLKEEVAAVHVVACSDELYEVLFESGE